MSPFLRTAIGSPLGFGVLGTLRLIKRIGDSGNVERGDGRALLFVAGIGSQAEAQVMTSHSRLRRLVSEEGVEKES